LLLFVTDNYLRSLETTALSQEGLIRDPRTGAVSPYGINGQLAISALRDLQRSFANIQEATLAGANSASKSGASFIFSGDGRFIMKSVRSEEFRVLTGQLIERIAVRARFDLAKCTSEDSPWCWASHALAHTTLVVPLLAFSNPKQKEYWIAMPAAAQMRGLVTSHNFTQLSPWGTVFYFDTKPLPAKSNARSKFMRKLAELGFLPKAPMTYSAQASQWSGLEEALLKDVELLSVKTQEDESLVDYSLLFELYQPSRKVRDPGPGCISSFECFYLEGEGDCWVLCVSVIDYLVTYGPMRKLESFFKGGKFNGYGTKVAEMLHCSFGQALPVDTHAELFHMDAQDQQWLYRFPRGPEEKQKLCAEYTELACGDLKISDCDVDLKHIEFVGHNFRRRFQFCGSFWAWKAIELESAQRLQDEVVDHGLGTGIPFPPLRRFC